jgi:hypothetical protein
MSGVEAGAALIDQTVAFMARSIATAAMTIMAYPVIVTPV